MALTQQQLSLVAEGISSNPMDRVPTEMKALINSDKKVLFDADSHVFNQIWSVNTKRFLLEQVKIIEPLLT